FGGGHAAIAPPSPPPPSAVQTPSPSVTQQPSYTSGTPSGVAPVTNTAAQSIKIETVVAQGQVAANSTGALTNSAVFVAGAVTAATPNFIYRSEISRVPNIPNKATLHTKFPDQLGLFDPSKIETVNASYYYSNGTWISRNWPVLAGVGIGAGALLLAPETGGASLAAEGEAEH